MRRLALLLALFAVSCASVGSDPASTPIEIQGNRILLPVRVNGGPPATFILDTGAASSPIDVEYARSRGIVSTGTTRAMGAGGAMDVGTAKDLTLETAGLTIRPQNSALIPIGPLSLRSGRPLHGVLGYEAFERAVVAIDYENGRIIFHSTDAFTPPAGATRVPLIFDHRVPRVDVQLTLPDGRVIPARLLVDTGAGSGVVLTPAFTRKHNIEVEGGIETSIGLGVGGALSERIGRIARVEVGGLTVDRPIAHLSHATAGVLGGSGVDGLFGGELLRRFDVALDYGRQQMWLTPNRRFAEPFEFDMSGAILAARDAAFDAVIVRDVLASSPAAEAGIRTGDELRALDGRAVTLVRIDEIRALFRRPGQRHELTIVRDGAEMVVPLVTRRLL